MNRDRFLPQSGGDVYDAAELMRHLDAHITDSSFREPLKASLKQLADVKYALDESSIVAITDRRGAIQYVNDKFCEISKYSREELLGKDHRIINSGYHDKAFMAELWSTIGSGRVWQGDVKNKAKDGSYYWVHTTIVPFVDDSGRPYQYLAIRNEVTRLKAVEEELQRMMHRVMNIQEEERKRFSRDLHDGIGQSLYSLLIRIDQLIAGGREGLDPLRRSVTDIIQEVRDLAWELRPSVLDDLGVVPAVRTYIDNYAQHYGVEVRFESGLRRRLSPQAETTVYRVIQEAMTNIAKYADVSEASVSILETEEAVVVRVADRGVGFNRDLSRQGVGLFSMEERAKGAGGTLEVASVPGEGTTVTLTLPKT